MIGKPESYYRTGQAAKQLGVSSYQVRRLCEAGEIAAEISAGQQWKIPLSEIARLKHEGVPPVPVEVEAEGDSEPEWPCAADDDDPPEGLYANPSERVTAARHLTLTPATRRRSPTPPANGRRQ